MTTTNDKRYRWGIIGCGKISNDFSNALKASAYAELYACASASSPERANEFAKTHGFKKSYGNYNDLCNDTNVDIVYIANLHPQHHHATILALNHGKHVLVEKPMAINSKEAIEMIDLAKEKKLFLMEGMWTRFFPAIKKVRELIKNKEIGDIISVTTEMCVDFSKDIKRIWEKEKGGGVLLDIGIYPLAMITMLFENESPIDISAFSKKNNNNVDIFTCATLEYKNNRFATMMCNALCNSLEETQIMGTKGIIKVHGPFHHGKKITVYKKDRLKTKQTFTFPLPDPPSNATPYLFAGSTGFLYEVNEVMNCITNHQIVHPLYNHQESLLIMDIMDKIRDKIGLIYEQDEK